MSLSEFGDAGKSAAPRLTSSPGEPVRVEATTRESNVRSDGSVCQYAVAGDVYHPTAASIRTLPPGAYGVVRTQSGLAFQGKSLNVDELIQFPGSRHAKILSEVDDFWTKTAVFAKHGFLHRRGYLFYGPAGGGKTSMIQQICASIIKSGDLVFLLDTDPGIFRSALHTFRTVEPDRRLVCVFEDIDAIIDRYGEDEMLSVLDGEQQINHVLNIATTNYPEKLDKRIVARPRRFDQIVKVGMPTASMREIFFRRKLQVDDAEIAKWVSATDKFSFAACAELAITVLCLNNDFATSAKRLSEMLTSTPKSTDVGSTPAGFNLSGNASSDDE